MGETYIILDLKKLKIVKKWFKVLVFDSFGDVCEYGQKNLGSNNFKLIKL